jgi:adenylate kinase
MKASNVVISFLGPPGCGKGTQSKLLQEKFGFAFFGSGDLLRQRGQVNDFTGQKIKKIINQGRLISSLVIAGLWEKEMERVKNLPQFSGLIIDGSPRALSEAKLIDSGLDWYEWTSKHKVVYLNISYEESEKRLLAKMGRHRKDDTVPALEERWNCFRNQTLPVLEYYRQKGALIEIDGNSSVQEVYQSMVRALKLE